MNQDHIRKAASGAATAAATTAKSFLSDLVDKRSTEIGRSISATATDLRNAGDGLRDKPAGSGIAMISDGAAGYAGQLGDYLQSADTDRLMTDLEALGRRRPYVVAAGALVVGFIASRLLKSSSARRYYREYAPYGGSAVEGTANG